MGHRQVQHLGGIAADKRREVEVVADDKQEEFSIVAHAIELTKRSASVDDCIILLQTIVCKVIGYIDLSFKANQDGNSGNNFIRYAFVYGIDSGI